ncbi:MAG: SNF2-related protein [Eubacteriales bacterium]|nr:SNF2-related protein [Eubacteriales bacterium]
MQKLYKGKTEEEIVKELEGVIFYNPISNTYEPKEEYLSGNIQEKLTELYNYITYMSDKHFHTEEEIEETKKKYAYNLKKLNEVLPPNIPFEAITIKIGSNVITNKQYEKFLTHLISTSYDINYSSEQGYNVKPTYYNNTTDSNIIEYGTSRMPADKIFEHLLNFKPLTIYDKVYDYVNKKEIRELNTKETELAQSKADKIKEEFEKWLNKDEILKKEIERKYNKMYNNIRPREYDGSYLTFPLKSNEITLMEHQKNAIAHILHGNNTLLAHCVGAGKTFEMVASIMEGKRLGLITKAMICVPNHLTTQTSNEFLALYPTANILVATEKDFSKENRLKLLQNIALNNYDAVIIGHSQLQLIPLSLEKRRQIIEKQIEETEEAISYAQYSSPTTQKKITKTITKCKSKNRKT